MRAGRTQVVISSMHLSDMTGVQLARQVRADPSFTQVGLVLATSESEQERAAEVQGLARAALTPKPFDQSRLVRAIAEALGVKPSIEPRRSDRPPGAVDSPARTHFGHPTG